MQMLQKCPQNTKSKPFIIIFGPTASGKSALALSLAKHLDGAIINADSRQIFHGLPILSASPSSDDKSAVPHYLYDHLAWSQHPYNTALWASSTSHIIENIISYQPPIITGGTGFYLNTLIKGIPNIPKTPPFAHNILSLILKSPILANIAYKALIAWDPNITFHKNNYVYLLRALSIAYTTKQKPSLVKKKPTLFTTRPHLTILLQPPKHILDERIAQRTKQMFQHNVIEEVLSFYAQNKIIPPVIGFQEILELERNNLSKEQVIEKIIILTRQYAKRQISFARNHIQADIIYPHIFTKKQWPNLLKIFQKKWCH